MKVEYISLRKKTIYSEGRMKLGRPVSGSQSLFTRNCWLRTGSFLLLLKKMAASKDEVPSDSFAERYRHSDFLYSRNDQYKIVDLHFF